MAGEDKEDDNSHNDYLKYKKAMNRTSTDVLKLLNGHLLAEYYLEQIILVSIPRGDILLDKGRLQFYNKLLIVRSLDVLKDNLLTSLEHLNKLRNSISHEIDYKITEANIDIIGRPFGQRYTKVKADAKPDKLLEKTLMLVIARLSGAYRKQVNNHKSQDEKAD